MNQMEYKKRIFEMLSHMLGLVVWLILGIFLKKNGITYFGIAMELYLMAFLIVGSGISNTLGRMIYVRKARGQYKDADKLKKTAFFLFGFLALLMSIVFFLAANTLSVQVFKIPYSAPIIRILAPAIFLRTILSVFLGRFQGEGSALPTVITCIARQILILLFSVLFIFLFEKQGVRVSALLREEQFTAMYAGMGVALAVLVSELILCIYLIFLMQGSGKQKRKENQEGMRTTDSVASQAASLFYNEGPEVFRKCLIFLPVVVALILFARGIQDNSVLISYGNICGTVLPVICLFTIPGCCLLLGGCSKIISCMKKGDSGFARKHFYGCFHMTVVYGLFCTVFVAVLAPEFAGVFGEETGEMLTNLIRIFACTIFFNVTSFFFTELLFYLGRKLLILGMQVIYFGTYIGSFLLFFKGGKGEILAFANAALLAGFVYLIVVFGLLLQLQFAVDWLSQVAVPVGCVCGMGLVIMFLAKGIAPHLGHVITLLVTWVIANLLYWIVLLFLRNFREQELAYTPGGKVIRVLGQTLRVY